MSLVDLAKAPGKDDEAPGGFTEEEEVPVPIGRLSLAPSGGKKLLVLDVNKLLVHAVFCGGTEAVSVPKSRKPDLVVGRKSVFKRPFCDDFLSFCFDKFLIAIWSSAMSKNVVGVIKGVLGAFSDRLLFIWDQSKCTDTGFKTIQNAHKPIFLKELRKLWDEHRNFSAKNTLLIDDSPYKALLNPPNTAIFPRPYEAAQMENMDFGPGGELRTFLEGLATTDEEVPAYVATHPLGQKPISEAHPDWPLYSRILNRTKGNGLMVIRDKEDSKWTNRWANGTGRHFRPWT